MDNWKPLMVGEKKAELPIVQGGMGVGVSLGNLAGHVAAEGGVGIISSAQIGYRDPEFYHDQPDCNARALVEELQKAKKIAGGNGLVGVNVMCALKHYREHVQIAAQHGADLIVCGAGLPMDLPELVQGTEAAIAPIVSSARCVQLIMKRWLKRYDRLPDLVVIEGPKAGGHLGFSQEEAEHADSLDFEQEIQKIIRYVKETGKEKGKDISVVVAGNIFTHEDVVRTLELGADGVQLASRFVATYECDASPEFKKAYLEAGPEDIRIIKSPVGMPGRAIDNAFLREIDQERQKVSKCYQCLRKCDPSQIPYCITEALIRAVQGDVEHGLVFAGANVGRIQEMTSVHALIRELLGQDSHN